MTSRRSADAACNQGTLYGCLPARTWSVGDGVPDELIAGT